MFSSSQKYFLQQLNNQLPVYLRRLALPSQMGRFLPCETGTTELGKQLALGYSCFALKTYYMLGLWNAQDAPKQAEWIHSIKSYQVKGQYGGHALTANAFIDPALVDFHKPRYTLPQRVVRRFWSSDKLTFQQAVVIAETKQAIATLLEVGENLDQPYAGFPRSPESVQKHISQLDWTKPWGAGGQASALVVFLITQAPQLMNEQDVGALVDVCKNSFTSLVDAQSGLYFRGKNSAFIWSSYQRRDESAYRAGLAEDAGALPRTVDQFLPYASSLPGGLSPCGRSVRAVSLPAIYISQKTRNSGIL